MATSGESFVGSLKQRFGAGITGSNLEALDPWIEVAPGSLPEVCRYLRDEPIAPLEIEETRSYLLGLFPYGLQTVEGLVARLRDIVLHDLPLDHTARVIETYRAIDGAELTSLARTHLDPRSCLIVAAGPAAQIAPQLEALAPPRIVQAAPAPGGAAPA